MSKRYSKSKSPARRPAKIRKAKKAKPAGRARALLKPRKIAKAAASRARAGRTSARAARIHRMKRMEPTRKAAHTAAKLKLKSRARTAGAKSLPKAKAANKQELAKKAKLAAQGNAKKQAGKKEQITLAAEPEPAKKRVLSKEMKEILSQPATRHLLIELGGENTLSIIKALPEVPNDENISKKLKIRISDVRASLNKLHNDGLVAYLRDKNSETGWYSYAWVLNEDRIRKWVVDQQASKASQFSCNGVDVYFCKDCGLGSATRFEAAIENKFKCPVCSCSMDLLDEQKYETLRKAKDE